MRLAEAGVASFFPAQTNSISYALFFSFQPWGLSTLFDRAVMHI